MDHQNNYQDQNYGNTSSDEVNLNREQRPRSSDTEYMHNTNRNESVNTVSDPETIPRYVPAINWNEFVAAVPDPETIPRYVPNNYEIARPFSRSHQNPRPPGGGDVLPPRSELGRRTELIGMGTYLISNGSHSRLPSRNQGIVDIPNTVPLQTEDQIASDTETLYKMTEPERMSPLAERLSRQVVSICLKICTESTTRNHTPGPTEGSQRVPRRNGNLMSSISKNSQNLPPSENDLSDSDNEHEGSPESQVKMVKSTNALKIFACPYFKYDSSRYSAENTGRGSTERIYQRCATARLTSISRVKQHLSRVHTRPEHYCATCFTDFSSQTEKDIHDKIRMCAAGEDRFAEKMNSDQIKAIRLCKIKDHPVRSWFQIYTIIFPGARHPMSPYRCVESYDCVELFIRVFRSLEPEMAHQVHNVLLESKEGFKLLGPDIQNIIGEAFELGLTNVLESVERCQHRKQQQQQQKHQERSILPPKSNAVGSDENKAKDAVMQDVLKIAPGSLLGERDLKSTNPSDQEQADFDCMLEYVWDQENPDTFAYQPWENTSTFQNLLTGSDALANPFDATDQEFVGSTWPSNNLTTDVTGGEELGR